MPTSTARYRFEFRLSDWAHRFASDLAGARASFFVAFREDGSVRRVYVARPGDSFDGESKAKLAESHERWFLFSPYDEEGTAYLEWLGLDRETVERWLGRRLEVTDFMDVRSTGTRDAWPDTWRVIIA
jgi:hypothetical protein